MNPETPSDAAALSLIVAMPLDDLVSSKSDDVIQLDSCSVFERIVVRTGRSVYDIIVLSSDEGEVMIRGGRFFPEFQRATIAGSIFGGSAVKLRNICVGLHLELHVNGKSFVTSRIRAVSRRRLPHRHRHSSV
jgi:hypothetical protein